MKKIYLVKKDPLMPPSEDNWIYMNEYQYCRFIETPEGKKRKKNFGNITGADDGDIVYIVECGESKAKQYRREIDRHDYLREIEEKENITIISLDSPVEEGNDADERGYLDKFIISDEDLTKDTLKKLDIDMLYLAINSLDDEEKWIIQKLFFDEKTMSARELSKMMNIPQKTLHYRKTQIFKKIRTFF